MLPFERVSNDLVVSGSYYIPTEKNPGLFLSRHLKKKKLLLNFNSKSIIKKIRLFCAAPPEFITGPILTISGFK